MAMPSSFLSRRRTRVKEKHLRTNLNPYYHGWSSSGVTISFVHVALCGGQRKTGCPKNRNSHSNLHPGFPAPKNPSAPQLMPFSSVFESMEQNVTNHFAIHQENFEAAMWTFQACHSYSNHMRHMIRKAALLCVLFWREIKKLWDVELTSLPLSRTSCRGASFFSSDAVDVVVLISCLSWAVKPPH
jgi:hypothetical protein